MLLYQEGAPCCWKPPSFVVTLQQVIAILLQSKTFHGLPLFEVFFFRLIHSGMAKANHLPPATLDFFNFALPEPTQLVKSHGSWSNVNGIKFNIQLSSFFFVCFCFYSL